MATRYCILGAGRQGTAAAYDLARFGSAKVIVLADANPEVAQASAARVNLLAGKQIAQGAVLDVRETRRVREFLSNYDVCLSAVPYYFNRGIATEALRAHTSMCDLGGNTQVVLEELALDAAAREAGITLVPDCGVGPGMATNLAVYAIEQFDRVREVLIYDGGLPQNPRPPFNYLLFFAIEGLTNEYYGDASYLENGLLTRVRTFDEREYELLDIPPIGKLEAFTTAGGLSTLTQTYAGKLQVLKNKTLRYPGHYALFKGLVDLGFLDVEPVQVGNHSIVPREFFHKHLGPHIAPRPEDRDLVVIHIVAHGEKNGQSMTATVDLLDRYDEATGFSAMERTTGFHLAIVAEMIACRQVPNGARPLELVVNAQRMVEELSKRGMEIKLEMKFGG